MSARRPRRHDVPEFKTEAELCAAFVTWAKDHDGIRVFAEWAGWDLLLVFPDGRQLGIQAKLRLNADVLLQAHPDRWSWDFPGPDFRAVLVPFTNPMSGVAARLGLEVFSPCPWKGFSPRLEPTRGTIHDGNWLDWNPSDRHELPPVETDSIAGSPCPVVLTPWKLGALEVLAELEVLGTITTKRMREIGVHPGRWTTGHWLAPGERRGLWVRGPRCPRFDEQHPTAYAAAKARAGAAKVSA